MLIAEKLGSTPADVFDNWAERVDTARTANKEIRRILPEGQTRINGVKVKVKPRGDYYWLIINNKRINAWHKTFVDEYGLECLAWEMAKTYALTEGTFRR